EGQEEETEGLTPATLCRFAATPVREERAMSESTLVAETGRPTGSRASGRLRAAGKIPGVLYGHGLTPVPLAIDRRELRHALSGPAGVNAVRRPQVGADTQPTG